MGTTVEIEYNEVGSTIGVYELVPGGEQSWFWTNVWQESVAHSLEQIANGEGTTFTSSEDFLAGLDNN